MKPQAAVMAGVVMLALGLGIMLIAPNHVTWGNHHYLSHWASKIFFVFGAVFLVFGLLKRGQS